MIDFYLTSICLLHFSNTKLAHGIVFLVRKKGGKDDGQLYAMKVLKKSAIVRNIKMVEYTKTEREVCKKKTSICAVSK